LQGAGDRRPVMGDEEEADVAVLVALVLAGHAPADSLMCCCTVPFMFAGAHEAAHPHMQRLVPHMLSLPLLLFDVWCDRRRA
jgi:hypothetical protein